jgi:cytochrome bd-type quinol oxidase subunit 2
MEAKLRTARELISRGNNLFVCGFVAVVGLAALPQLPTEGVKGALDEGGMVLLGLGAIAWYLTNRFKNTWLALAFPIVLIALKVVALLIENADDRGDDIGILMTALILAISWGVIKLRSAERLDGVAVAAASRS